jgi:hypothetical protein
MLYFVIKCALSGIIIAAVSEIAKRSPAFGALVVSLPLFLILPAMLRAGAGFWPSLAASCAVTVILYFITAWVLARFGIHL